MRQIAWPPQQMLQRVARSVAGTRTQHGKEESAQCGSGGTVWVDAPCAVPPPINQRHQRCICLAASPGARRLAVASIHMQQKRLWKRQIQLGASECIGRTNLWRRARSNLHLRSQVGTAWQHDSMTPPPTPICPSVATSRAFEQRPSIAHRTSLGAKHRRRHLRYNRQGSHRDGHDCQPLPPSGHQTTAHKNSARGASRMPHSSLHRNTLPAASPAAIATSTCVGTHHHPHPPALGTKAHYFKSSPRQCPCGSQPHTPAREPEARRRSI